MPGMEQWLVGRAEKRSPEMKSETHMEVPEAPEKGWWNETGMEDEGRDAWEGGQLVCGMCICSPRPWREDAP